MGKTIKTTIQVPEELLRKVRIKSAKTGISMSAICRLALARWVAEEKEKGEAEQ